MRLKDADVLIEKIKYESSVDGAYGYMDAKSIVDCINDAPTIEGRKMGHWERHNTYHGDDVSGSIDPDWRCSECGGQANVNAWCLYDLTDFCPHCGADMRGEKE